jgi:hypothetical protein
LRRPTADLLLEGARRAEGPERTSDLSEESFGQADGRPCRYGQPFHEDAVALGIKGPTPSHGRLASRSLPLNPSFSARSLGLNELDRSILMIDRCSLKALDPAMLKEWPLTWSSRCRSRRGSTCIWPDRDSNFRECRMRGSTGRSLRSFWSAVPAQRISSPRWRSSSATILRRLRGTATGCAGARASCRTSFRCLLRKAR